MSPATPDIMDIDMEDFTEIADMAHSWPSPGPISPATLWGKGKGKGKDISEEEDETMILDPELGLGKVGSSPGEEGEVEGHRGAATSPRGAQGSSRDVMPPPRGDRRPVKRGTGKNLALLAQIQRSQKFEDIGSANNGGGSGDGVSSTSTSPGPTLPQPSSPSYRMPCSTSPGLHRGGAAARGSSSSTPSPPVASSTQSYPSPPITVGSDDGSQSSSPKQPSSTPATPGTPSTIDGKILSELKKIQTQDSSLVPADKGELEEIAQSINVANELSAFVTSALDLSVCQQSAAVSSSKKFYFFFFFFWLDLVPVIFCFCFAFKVVYHRCRCYNLKSRLLL